MQVKAAMTGTSVPDHGKLTLSKFCTQPHGIYSVWNIHRYTVTIYSGDCPWYLCRICLKLVSFQFASALHFNGKMSWIIWSLLTILFFIITVSLIVLISHKRVLGNCDWQRQTVQWIWIIINKCWPWMLLFIEPHSGFGVIIQHPYCLSGGLSNLHWF